MIESMWSMIVRGEGGSDARERSRKVGQVWTELTRQRPRVVKLAGSLISAMTAQQLKALYNDLQRSFNARPSDLKRCGTLLAQLKLGLIETGLLLPQGDLNLDDLIVARDILEIGAFWSIRTQDVPSFDRYFSQLQTFYTDYSSVLPPSKREYPIRGLNLIRLLTQNRIADFHTTLESLPLPADAIGDNPFIAHPVNLERWLMEGSYSKVWNAREEAPAEEYKYFVDSLMGTIRGYADGPA
ncbi:hypothetical protein D9615_000252 [Tricholomella constricta]|uniref:PCI domain-containing protein n=1 Tax=Tricholomella constricta TaxID=117010 RepID=A0A8H5MCB2_9AGAR|nr:hypothetical protein D9615_000252 [Tricholomella constricta]